MSFSSCIITWKGCREGLKFKNDAESGNSPGLTLALKTNHTDAVNSKFIDESAL
jgi:hypothetical protein